MLREAFPQKNRSLLRVVKGFKGTCYPLSLRERDFYLNTYTVNRLNVCQIPHILNRKFSFYFSLVLFSFSKTLNRRLRHLEVYYKDNNISVELVKEAITME